MGAIRTILALYVVHSHGGDVFPDWLPKLTGRESVQLFFVISGFYMTLILNQKYATPESNKTFYVNRFLRLWPPFIIVNIVSIIIIFYTGDVRLQDLHMQAGEFVREIRNFDFSALLLVIVSNVLIVGQDILFYVNLSGDGIAWAPYRLSGLHNGSSFSLNAPSFTIAIEAAFYLMAPFVLRRSWRLAASIMAVAFVFHLYLFGAGAYHVALYYHWIGPSLFYFMIGALSYHLYIILERHRKEGKIEILYFEFGSYFFVFCLALFYQEWSTHIDSFPRMLIYGPIFGLLVPFVFHQTRSSAVDKFIGDLSYSIYLIHYPALFLVPGLLGAEFQGRPAALIAVALAVVMLCAVDRPLDRYRQSIARKRTARQGRAALETAL